MHGLPRHHYKASYTYIRLKLAYSNMPTLGLDGRTIDEQTHPGVPIVDYILCLQNR